MMIQGMVLQNFALLFTRYHSFIYYRLEYLLWMLPAIILTLIANYMVKSNYRKYSRIPNSRGLTGEAAARMVLQAHGINNIRIERVAGSLTDHFSPKENVIRLSEGVYSSASIASVCIAAHEAGHAVQHAEGYMPNQIRSSIVPAANISSKLAVPIILVGLLLPGGASNFFMTLGIAAYAIAILFYIVTLPVEFDASRRALSTIQSNYMLEAKEYDGAKKVLTAAALTYVAAALGALLNFIRLILIVAGNSRRN